MFDMEKPIILSCCLVLFLEIWNVWWEIR